MGFDPVARLAKLVKFNDYFDRARLEALGYFTVTNYNVLTIVEKDAAIASYRNGEVNALDVNYQLASDQDILRGLGANVFIKPEIGWQEFGFNMQHPIVGTGKGTPKGTAEAARHVRQAISYLTPRDLVVKQLLSGSGTPGTTVLAAFGSGFQDPSVKPDPYDPNLAKAELAAAGYQTGVNPITPTPPPPEVAADFIYGQAVPIEGTFKNPVTGAPYVNFVVRIQESKDQTNWVDTGYAPITDSAGNYHAMVVPSYQTTYFRANFTGAVVPTSVSGTWPIQAGNYYDQLVAAGKVQLVLPPNVGPVQQFTTKTLKDILTGALQPYATATSVTQLQSTVATKTDISGLTTQITALNASVSSLTTYLYAALGVAVIAIIIAIVAVVRKH